MISNDPIVDLRKLKKQEAPQSWQETVENAIPDKSQENQEPRREKDDLPAQAEEEMLAEWQAPEFVKYGEWPLKMTAGAVLAAVVLIAAAASGNFLLGALVILASLLLYYQSGKNPRMMSCKIKKEGVLLDRIFYPFEELKSFWIFNEPELDFKEISFVKKTAFSRPIKIALGEQNPEELQKILVKFLPEEKQKESFGEFLSRILTP